MRKVILLIILMIVLVSLNWFKELVAQDLSTMDPDELTRLAEEYKKSGMSIEEAQYYKSPEIFKSTTIDSMKEDHQGKASGEFNNSLSATKKENAISERSDKIPFDELLPYGIELFAHSGSSNSISDLASSSDYLLGPGDNVIIYLWGRVEKEYNVTLDREGKVIIPRVGEIVGWGLTLDQFTAKVKKHLEQVYSEFELSASLGKIRSIRIFVTGEVQTPGAYTVSSLTSVLNALFIAGGPNQRGSMRHIRIMRQGKPIAEFDLYNLLLKGDNSSDITLQSGDVIFVPVASSRVAIRGEVRRAAWFEMSDSATANDLIQLAGGAEPEAYLERVMLEHINDLGEWEVIDLNLKCDDDLLCNDIVLSDGDRLTVYSIFEARNNMVTIQGHVQHPGYYERNNETRLSDLLKRGQLRTYDVYMKRADLFRRYPDRRSEIISIDLTRVLNGDPEADILLKDRDSLRVYSFSEVQHESYVYIEGEVEKPGRYPLYSGMTAEDLIFLAGSYTRSASTHRAEIARLDASGQSTLINIDLENEESLTFELQEDDHLYIRPIPQWKQDRSIVITGEVSHPGTYWLNNDGETLRSIIRRCGGFTSHAFPQGLSLERPTIAESLNKLNIDELIKRSVEIERDSLGRIVKNEIQQYDVKSMNRIVVDINCIMNSDCDGEELYLQPGDRIYVPAKPSGISIMGAIGANGTIRYMEKKKVKYYIEKAGGFTRQADKSETRLIRAWGEVVSGGGILGKQVQDGDIIVVPSRIKEKKNWFKTMTQALTATTGILTSVYLVSKL